MAVLTTALWRCILVSAMAGETLQKGFSFTSTEIYRLFGPEAAEDEDPSRLREYYFKSVTYSDVTAKLPLRILVGHKGIGKSALFKIAMLEDAEDGQLPILIKPDDIAGLANDTSDFLVTIRAWRQGLSGIITRKVLETFGLDQSGAISRAQTLGAKLLVFIADTVKSIKGVDFSLDPTKKLLFDEFVQTNQINVYIDDLDRGWEGRREDIRRISALLNAVRDMANDNSGLRFKIGLRSDVYYLVRTSDESTDKIENAVVWQSWTNHEILVLLIKRIETFFGRGVHEPTLLGMKQHQLARYLNPVMEPIFTGQGLWANAPTYKILMSLIRKRPRDLVKLCTQAARNAHQGRSALIRTPNLQAIFDEYSQGRIQDAINEYRSELPDIERLLMNMRPSRKEHTAKQGYVYSTEGLLSKVSNITQGGEFRFANGKIATHKELAAFMYKINFLTARKETLTGIVRRYFEENRYLSSQFVDFGFQWEIHPAYRWALQPESIQSIFESLALSADDD
jgi:hypothetical protein